MGSCYTHYPSKRFQTIFKLTLKSNKNTHMKGDSPKQTRSPQSNAKILKTNHCQRISYHHGARTDHRQQKQNHSTENEVEAHLQHTRINLKPKLAIPKISILSCIWFRTAFFIFFIFFILFRRAFFICQNNKVVHMFFICQNDKRHCCLRNWKRLLSKNRFRI